MLFWGSYKSQKDGDGHAVAMHDERRRPGLRLISKTPGPRVTLGKPYRKPPLKGKTPEHAPPDSEVCKGMIVLACTAWK